MPHRRFFKSHSPFDAVPHHDSVRYVYVARDGRDVARSTYDTFYLGARKVKGEPALDFRSYFLNWLASGGGDLPYFQHIASWWRARERPNVRLVHYMDLKTDLENQVRSIAIFLGVDPSGLPMQDIVARCSFSYMREHAAELLPGQEKFRPGVDRYMIFKGENDRWKDALTAENSLAYDEAARRELGEGCARWLASGGAAVRA
jgi:aryl sulfotransferase